MGPSAEMFHDLQPCRITLLRHRRRSRRIDAESQAGEQAVDERMPGVDRIVGRAACHSFRIGDANGGQTADEVMVPFGDLLAALSAFAHYAGVGIAGREEDGRGKSYCQHVKETFNHFGLILG